MAGRGAGPCCSSAAAGAGAGAPAVRPGGDDGDQGVFCFRYGRRNPTQYGAQPHPVAPPNACRAGPARRRTWRAMLPRAASNLGTPSSSRSMASRPLSRRMTRQRRRCKRGGARARRPRPGGGHGVTGVSLGHTMVASRVLTLKGSGPAGMGRPMLTPAAASCTCASKHAGACWSSASVVRIALQSTAQRLAHTPAALAMTCSSDEGDAALLCASTTTTRPSKRAVVVWLVGCGATPEAAACTRTCPWPFGQLGAMRSLQLLQAKGTHSLLNSHTHKTQPTAHRSGRRSCWTMT